LVIESTAVIHNHPLFAVLNLTENAASTEGLASASTIIRPSFLARIGSMTVIGSSETRGYPKMGAVVRAVFRDSK